MLPMMTPPAGWTLAGARRWKNPVSRRCCCSNGRYCCSGAFLPSLPLSLSRAARVMETTDTTAAAISLSGSASPGPRRCFRGRACGGAASSGKCRARGRCPAWLTSELRGQRAPRWAW